MKIKLSQIFENLTELSKLVHFDIQLHGWPATIAVIAACGAAVAVKIIPLVHKEGESLPEQEQISMTENNDNEN